MQLFMQMRFGITFRINKTCSNYQSLIKRDELCTYPYSSGSHSYIYVIRPKACLLKTRYLAVGTQFESIII